MALQDTSVHATPELFAAAAEQAALLGAPVRLKILVLLAQSPKAVEDLADGTGESIANISQHLKKLKEGGLLLVRKQGLLRIYELADPRVGLWLETLFDISEITSPRFQSHQRQMTEENEWVSTDGRPLHRALEDARIVVLDVRPEEETQASPVEGALSIPLEELRSRVSELSRNKVYWLVCRGRTCGQATEGVRLLRKKGLQAFRLKESPLSLRYQQRSLRNLELKSIAAKKVKKG